MSPSESFQHITFILCDASVFESSWKSTYTNARKCANKISHFNVGISLDYKKKKKGNNKHKSYFTNCEYIG